MTHLEHALRTMRPNQFGEPRYESRGFRMIRYRSPATALAIRRAAAQESTGTSSVLLAAFAVPLARFTEHGQVMSMLLVSNRFRPGFADSVSPVMQLSPFLIDVGDVSLRAAIARAGTSVFNAYKNAYFDPYDQDPVIERVEAERGELDYSCLYNDRRRPDEHATTLPTDDEIRAALPHAERDWEFRPDMSRRLFLTVADGPDAVDFVLTADTRFFSDIDMIALTGEFEHVTVQTAIEPTLPTGVATTATVGR